MKQVCLLAAQEACDDETLLGTASLALCGREGGVGLVLEFDAASGRLRIPPGFEGARELRLVVTCDAQRLEGDGTNNGEADANKADVLAVARSLGAALTLERYICSLRTLDCSWQPAHPSVREIVTLPKMDRYASHFPVRVLGPRPCKRRVMTTAHAQGYAALR
eukprot:48685-Pleurochrysis_carterae.AAC.1